MIILLLMVTIQPISSERPDQSILRTNHINVVTKEEKYQNLVVATKRLYILRFSIFNSCVFSVFWLERVNKTFITILIPPFFSMIK